MVPNKDASEHFSRHDNWPKPTTYNSYILKKSMFFCGGDET
jgi:hypothetical protein